MNAAAPTWIYIDLAPKDGTPVLVGWKGKDVHPLVGHFEGDDATGQWGYLNADVSFTPFTDPPTHFMWLPRGPE